MGWVEKSVDDLPSFPRLDAQECMKRAVCEAHHQPKKYGLTGLVLQIFFPYGRPRVIRLVYRAQTPRGSWVGHCLQRFILPLQIE